MPMSRILITGAGRGIGREFARQYRETGAEVVATCRSAEAAADLKGLGCTTAIVDMTDAAAIDAFAATIAAQSLDVAILNAGTAGRRTPVLELTEPDDFDAVMRTNVFGPMRLIPALLDRVAEGGRIAMLSSRMGSVGLTTNGRSALYRASKAALNAVARAAAVELAARGVIVVVLSPGWVRTDMGGADADLDVVTSVAGMRTAIERTTVAESGRFVDHSGAPIIW
jgi:NAD(P)-dependent dehydrogenase (short-subunit alcohol dehydrogenase family)